MTNEAERATVIGRRRAALRVERGLTQAQLAAAAGVSSAPISRAENGSPVDEDTVRKLAAALGIEARDYFEPPAYATPAAPVPAGTQP